MSALSQRGLRGWWLVILRWAAALAVLGLLLYFLPVAPLRAAIARVPVSVFLSVLLGIMFRLRKKILAGRSVWFRRRLARLRHAFRSVSKRPRVLIFGWLLGTGIQLSFLWLTAQLAEYCGLTLPLRAWLFAWPLAKLAAVLPLTQGGIGVREAALVVLLAPFGAPGHLVLAAGLVWEGVVIAGGLIAGAVAFTLGKRADAS